MVFKNFDSANNAICLLDLPITNLSTTIIGKGNFDRFPTSNFIIKVTQYDTDGVTIIGRENILIDTRVDETFTVAASGRAYEPVPIDDDQTSNIQQALPFLSDSVIECVITSEFMKDIQEELIDIRDVALPLKADQADVDALANTYFSASGGTDTYAFSIPGVVSYASIVGKKYSFVADVDCT